MKNHALTSSLNGTAPPKLSLRVSAPNLPCSGIRKLRSVGGPRRRALNVEDVASVSSEMYQPSKLNDKSFKVLSLVASCVEINVSSLPTYDP
jgi:hypothetical protein